jgi:hypothetical protein
MCLIPDPYLSVENTGYRIQIRSIKITAMHLCRYVVLV